MTSCQAHVSILNDNKIYISLEYVKTLHSTFQDENRSLLYLSSNIFSSRIGALLYTSKLRFVFTTLNAML